MVFWRWLVEATTSSASSSSCFSFTFSKAHFASAVSWMFLLACMSLSSSCLWYLQSSHFCLWNTEIQRGIKQTKTSWGSGKQYWILRCVTRCPCTLHSSIQMIAMRHTLDTTIAFLPLLPLSRALSLSLSENFLHFTSFPHINLSRSLSSTCQRQQETNK